MRLNDSPPNPLTVLAKASAYDNRKPDPTTATAWAEALNPDMTTQDALNAVTAHYAQETRWIMPADINHHWQATKRARLDKDQQHQTPTPPYGLTPQQELTWKRKRIEAITHGANREQSIQYANQQVGLPPTTTSTPIEAPRNVSNELSALTSTLGRVPPQKTRHSPPQHTTLNHPQPRQPQPHQTPQKRTHTMRQATTTNGQPHQIPDLQELTKLHTLLTLTGTHTPNENTKQKLATQICATLANGLQGIIEGLIEQETNTPELNTITGNAKPNQPITIDEGLNALLALYTGLINTTENFLNTDN